MPACPTLAVIADDLTGALDAVVPFAMAGLRVVVATAPEHVAAALQQGADVIGLSTNSRDLSAADAGAVSATVAAALADVPRWFKKIDSRMKGNIAAEVAGLRHLRGFDRVLICPAIPQMGRVVVDGRLQGFGVDVPVPVAAVLAGMGLQVSAPDAVQEGDLDRALDAAGDALLVGARGLSAALARRMGRGIGTTVDLPLPQPIAFAIGSRDPITLAQVAALRQGMPAAAFVGAPNGQTAEVSSARVAILQAIPGVQAAAPGAVTQALAAGFVRGFVAGRACLVLSGGETAAAVLALMGVGLLEVLGEALPGLPLARALHVTEAPLILTKSGGFGDADTLRRLIDPTPADMRCAVEQT